MSSLDVKEDGTCRSPIPEAEGKIYRLCKNYTDEQICNWAVPASNPQSLCFSCRLTRTIPDLSQPGHRPAWYRLEMAKRRVIYTLLQLSLPLHSFEEDCERGLAFEFKADAPGAKVLTGHLNGVITIDVSEADDVERERQRKAVHEPYRTIVGHIRHEVGHYYWERLIGASTQVETFRSCSAMNARTTQRPFRPTTTRGHPPIGRTPSSALTRVPIRGKTGLKPGPTIFTWLMPWKLLLRAVFLLILTGKTSLR